jgi:methionyl-tRNA formyltransferase
MRLAFMGTPEFAVAALDALVAAGHEIACVYTQPPRPADRGRITPSAVHRRAEALGLLLRTPERLRDAQTQAAFAALDLDAAVVAAYGLLLPRAVLEAPRLGCLNIHASLLPRWRGAAPIQRAILAGDRETGVTIMRMAAGLDTGPMLMSEATPIARKTTGELTNELAAMGARLMLAALGRLGALSEVPQDDAAATLAPRIDKAEARIDWRQPAETLDRLVRAMNPAPGAWFEGPDGRVKLWAAEPVEGDAPPGTPLPGGAIACGSGALHLLRVQPAGRGAMAAADWWRGVRLAPGQRLG